MLPPEVLLVSLLLALTTTLAVAQDPSPRPGQHRMGQPVMHRPGMPVLPPGQDPLQWVPGPNVLRGERPGELEIVLDVPPGFHVYRDQLEVQVLDGADLHVGPPDIPPGMVRLVPGQDEVPREQYDTDIVVRIPARAADADPGLRTMQVRVRHQGCFAGHCYRPQERVLSVHVPVRPDGADHAHVPVDAEGNPLPNPLEDEHCETPEAPSGDSSGSSSEPSTAPPVDSTGSWERTHPAPNVVVYIRR